MLRHVATLFSLLLLIASGFLCVQSYRRPARFEFMLRGMRWEIASSYGALRLDNQPQLEFEASQFSEAAVADLKMAEMAYERSVKFRQLARARISGAGELPSNDRRALKTAAEANSKVAWQRLKDVDDRLRKRVTRVETEYFIPWAVLYLLTLPLPVHWLFVRARRRRRIRNGRCVKCGYDLRASGDRCPECGSVAPG